MIISSLDPNRWRRLERVLDQALALSTDERVAYLAQALAAEPDLRTEIEEILAADDRAGGMLDRPVGDYVSNIVGAASARPFDPEDRSGSILGTYELIERLGCGGMGEVYRARDTRLGRSVAVKLLRPDLANDASFVSRLHHEARLLASLEHSRIARLYSFEQFEGDRFLAMELVDGETLAERLAPGPLPAGEALRVCAQIAEGLDGAHLIGVVHRDLKPGNVLLDADGDAHLVDFGIARSVEPPADPGATRPTGKSHLTQPGALLGTAPYMSPEQVRGQPVDARADIWALGCTLFECLAGESPFRRPTMADTLSAILSEQPDYSRLPVEIPARIRRLLERMLQKDPRDRQRSAGDAWLELREAVGPRTRTAMATGLRPAPWTRWGLGAVVLAGVAATVTWWLLPGANPAARPIRRFEVPLPADTRLERAAPSLAISPDGRSVVFNADDRLWLRRLDELTSTPLPGTERARLPFFSPDGTQVGFWQTARDLSQYDGDGQIKRIPIQAGGAPVAVVPAPEGTPAGASWGEDGYIYWARPAWAGQPGIVRVAERGGVPEMVVESAEGEFTQGPRPLPGGEWLMFAVTRTATGRARDIPVWTEAEVVIHSLRSGERRVLIPGGTDPRYSPAGHIVVAQDYNLLATPFDLTTGTVNGTAVSMLSGVHQSSMGGRAQYALSSHGDLVYLPGVAAVDGSRLVWADRAGNTEPLPFEPASFGQMSLSPDGTRVAVAVGVHDRADIWIYEIERGGRMRLTSEGDNAYPVWSADGDWIYFASVRDRDQDIWRRRADLSLPAERVLEMEGDQRPDDLPTSGEVLLFTTLAPGGATGNDIWMLPLTGDSGPRQLLGSPSSESKASASPDGRFIAFVSASPGSGTLEVVVQEIATGRLHPVSTAELGGIDPVWAADGRRIFFYSSRSGFVSEGCSSCPGPQLLEVDVTLDPRFSVSPPRLIGEVPHVKFSRFVAAPNGQRFLVVQSLGDPGPTPPDRFAVVLNWTAGLEQERPPRR